MVKSSSSLVVSDGNFVPDFFFFPILLYVLLGNIKDISYKELTLIRIQWICITPKAALQPLSLDPETVSEAGNSVT